MATIKFTDHLKKHINCQSREFPGNTLSEVLEHLFSDDNQLASYIVNDQGCLRKHILISIDDQLIEDRIHFTDKVEPESVIYILQALSGG